MSYDPCPAGCGRGRNDGHLMCGPCWHRVPKHLQREVWRTWKAWLRDIGNADLMREYQAAKGAAIASLP